MGKWFKWDMLFTSFLPLWFSIIVSDVWAIMCKIIKYKTTMESCSISSRQLIKNCVFILSKAKIEVVSIFLLFVYSIISIHHINCVIKREKKSCNKRKGRIVRAKKANKLTAEFLLAYILPMLAFDFSCLKSIVLFLVYFSVLSFLCVRNSNVYTNIFFEIKNYRMYDCDIECPVLNESKIFTDCLIISKNFLTQTLPREIDYFDFENYIYIDIGE